MNLYGTKVFSLQTKSLTNLSLGFITSSSFVMLGMVASNYAMGQNVTISAPQTYSIGCCNPPAVAPNTGSILTITGSGSITNTAQWGAAGTYRTNNVGTTINNSGTITGYYGVLSSGNQTSINNLTASSQIVGTDYAIYNASGVIDAITNAGTISSSLSSAIYINSGTISTLTNTGTITAGGGNNGIYNGGGFMFMGGNNITTLNNAQGAGNTAGALTYNGKLPAYYNIIINSASGYGKLAVTSGTGTTAFGIYTGSTVANGTYTSVLSGTGITLAATTGSYNSATWTLSSSAGGIWDLIISGASTASTYRSNTLSYLRNYASGAAGMLDSLSAAPAMSGVITALNNLSGAAQANAITQTLPAITGAASQATTSSMQALNQIVQGRSNSLRGMASGDEYIGNRDMWMKGFGSWANQADVNGVSGYKINTGGLAIGVDQGFTPKLNIGAVLALSNSGVSSNSNSAPSGVTINSYQAGLYGDYAIDPKIIANAQADIGMNQNKEYRNITFMGTNANGNYNSYSAHLGTGVKYLMPIDMENTFIPSVRVDYTTVQSDAYSESGAGALNLSVAKQTYNTLIPSVDMRIDHNLDSKMVLSANAGAGYNTLNNQVSATSAYAGGGTTFATNGLQVSPMLYNAGVGVTGQIDKNLQLNVRYDNVFSPTGYMNQMVSAKLKIPL